MGDNDPIDACEIGTMVSVILSQLFCSLLYIPFYSCVLDCQTFEQEWDEEWPCFDTNVAAFQM